MESNSSSTTYPIKGMHCASCASIITKRLKKVQGVNDVQVNVATEQAKIVFEDGAVGIDILNETITPLGYTLFEQNVTNKMSTESADEVEVANDAMQMTLPFSVFVFVVMLWEIASTYTQYVSPLPMPMSFLTLILTTLSTFILFGPGMQFIKAIGTFVRFRVANMDTLIGIGTLVAYVYSMIRVVFPQSMSALGFDDIVYFDVVIVVIGFIKLGKYLELKSKRSTGEALKKLMQLQAKTAFVLRNGIQSEIPINEVKLGETLVIKPGTTIPLDGEVIDGESSVDESMVTGESLPVDVVIGSRVIGATMNLYGALRVKTTRTVGDTVLSRIMTMVSQAQGSKASIEKTVDRVSGIFVPTVLIIALITALVWTGAGFFVLPLSQAIVYAITAVVGVLVIACPCALGLATPTAIIVAVGRAAGMGILIKDAESLEKLHEVTAIVMDKTGTLTHGRPVVRDIIPLGTSNEKELMTILASLEAQSEHPLANAITAYAAEKMLTLKKIEKFKAVGGRGVMGFIGKISYMAGNAAFMKDSGVSIKHESISFTSQGKTPLYVSKGKTFLGVVYVADSIKDQAAASVQSLQQAGIRVIMATGDEKATAEYIAKQVGIEDVESHVDPQRKYEIVRDLQSKGFVVAMVGDGINDAPAIAAADVGIAMSTGTDVAITTANITLLHGDIAKVSHVIALSKQTMRVIKENLFWAFIYNIVGIPLAAGVLYPFTGVFLSPAFAGLAMAGSSVSVVANSLRLKKIRL